MPWATQDCVTPPSHSWLSSDLCGVWAPLTLVAWLQLRDHWECQESFLLESLFLEVQVCYVLCGSRWAHLPQWDPGVPIFCVVGTCTSISLSNQLGFEWGCQLLMKGGFPTKTHMPNRGRPLCFGPAVCPGRFCCQGQDFLQETVMLCTNMRKNE